jgi:alpha-mannosidase
MFTDDNCLKFFGTSVHAAAAVVEAAASVFWDTPVAVARSLASTTFELMSSSSHEKEVYFYIRARPKKN